MTNRGASDTTEAYISGLPCTCENRVWSYVRSNLRVRRRRSAVARGSGQVQLAPRLGGADDLVDARLAAAGGERDVGERVSLFDGGAHGIGDNLLGLASERVCTVSPRFGATHCGEYGHPPARPCPNRPSAPRSIGVSGSSSADLGRCRRYRRLGPPGQCRESPRAPLRPVQLTRMRTRRDDSPRPNADGRRAAVTG